MADTDTTDTSPEKGPKKGKKKLLLIGAVVLVLLCAGGGYLFLGGEDAEAAENEAPPEGEIVPVEEMTVNLAGPELHYARVAFSLVLAEGADPAVIEERKPLLHDAAITELTRLSPEELRGPEGPDTARDRLGARAKEIYPDGEVLRAVLTKLLVQ